MTVTVQAPAKINLTLDVLGKRPDGYHNLESIFQTVSRYDTLTLKKAEKGVTLKVDGDIPGRPEENIVLRAAALFFAETGLQAGAEISLTKTIPVQAGMGGGSADAAGTLAGLNRLYAAGLSTEQLCALGARLGADVPFFLLGGTALVSGIGEILRPITPLPPVLVAVAQPDERVNTAEAYRRLDTQPIPMRPNHTAALDALAAGAMEGFWPQCINVFENAMALPGVAEIRREMARFQPLASQMTGSGSAVFGLFEREDMAEACVASLSKRFPVSFVCRPCAGMQIE